MNTSIQGLRIIFVMMIFMSHFAYGDFTAFDAGGDCGVAFFFLLSGFLLTMGYGERLENGTFRYSAYLRRRLQKIYPLHLLCLLCYILLFRPVLDIRLPFNALLLQSWVPFRGYYFSYNGVSWFLSSLLCSYLLFPILYRWSYGWRLIVVAVCALMAYLLVPYDHVNSLLYVWPPMRCVDFIFGIALFRIYKRYQPSSAPTVWLEPLLVLLLVLALAAYPYMDAKLRNAPVYWLVLLPFIYVFARGEGSISRFLGCRAMQWLGELSMPVFLLHPIVLRLMFDNVPALPWWLMLNCCVTIVIALSWLIDRLLLRRFP